MKKNQSAAPLDDLGKLILRFALAVLVLFHGISKIIGGVSFIIGMLTRMGIPGQIAYLVYVGEVAAPAMILFGVWTRVAALVVAVDIIVAVLLVNASQFFTINKFGGWALELEGFYFITAIVIALQGAGRYSVGGIAGQWN